ncbi:hypothetical protein AD930_07755 [Acetobacter malorum]|nr:hypothetical protein AD930_07755 [Acetobacter malorum]
MTPSQLAARIVSELKAGNLADAARLSNFIIPIIGQAMASQQNQEDIDRLRGMHSALHNSITVLGSIIRQLQAACIVNPSSRNNLVALMHAKNLDATLATSAGILGNFLLARA